MTVDCDELNWRGYLTSQSIVSKDDESLLDVFESSLSGAPLPAPWSMWCDRKSNALFFTNTSTGETSWTHPLNALLVELASVAQRFWALPLGCRAEHLAALNRTWEAEARAEIMKWRSALDEGSNEYFYNVETRATMWERPVDALLPAFYLKKQYLKNLSEYCRGGASHSGYKEIKPGVDQASVNGYKRSSPSLAEESGVSVSWETYLTTKEVLKLPEEEDLLRVFQGVLKGAPLPAPWSMWCDKATQSLFFTNPSTRETSWTHPLQDVFLTLAEVGRRFFTIPVAIRAEHLAALNKTWDTEARTEILKWQTAYDDQDREYFFNAETMEVMWEKPAEAVLPAFFLKKQFLKRLSLSKPMLRERRDSTSQEPDRNSQSTMASTTNSSASSLSRMHDTRMRRTRRSSRKLSNHALFDDNWEYYLTTQGIVYVPGEEMLLQTFQSVLKIAPLPAPWRIWNDRANGRFFFVQKSTGMTSWQHPLNYVLMELASIARHYLSLDEESRADHLAMLGSKWDSQAEVEIAKWKSALDEEDMEYFFNAETSETMWERPEDVVLPELFLKRQFLSKLSVAIEPRPFQKPEPLHPPQHSQLPQPPTPPEPQRGDPVPVQVVPKVPPVPPEAAGKPSAYASLPPLPVPSAAGVPELKVQVKPPPPVRVHHSPTRVKIKSVSPKPSRVGEAIKVTVVRKTARSVSHGAPKACVVKGAAKRQVKVISHNAHPAPTITVRTLKEQASPQRQGAEGVPPQRAKAVAAAVSASSAVSGTSIEKLQAAAMAAYQVTSPNASAEEHASTVQQVLHEAAGQIQGLTCNGEALDTLAENAYFFAESVQKALEGNSDQLNHKAAAALASEAARDSGLSAAWQVDAAIAATLAGRFAGSPGSPSCPKSQQLSEVIEQIAHVTGVEAETRQSWLQKADQKLAPMLVHKGVIVQNGSQDLAATADSWMMGSSPHADSSPQSGTAETASMFGQTGRLSQTGSSKFVEFCNFRDVRRAMAEAENCLAAFEEERKLQRKALQRRRSRNKLPSDIRDAMGEAQRILFAFDEERRLQLQQLRVERAKSRTLP